MKKKYIEIKPKDIKGNFKVKIDMRKKTLPLDELYGYTFDQKFLEAQRALNWLMSDALYGGYKMKPKKLSRWEVFKINLKGRISDIRVSIAEWIGGDALHENCDY